MAAIRHFCCAPAALGFHRLWFAPFSMLAGLPNKPTLAKGIDRFLLDSVITVGVTHVIMVITGNRRGNPHACFNPQACSGFPFFEAFGVLLVVRHSATSSKRPGMDLATKHNLHLVARWLITSHQALLLTCIPLITGFGTWTCLTSRLDGTLESFHLLANAAYYLSLLSFNLWLLILLIHAQSFNYTRHILSMSRNGRRAC